MKDDRSPQLGPRAVGARLDARIYLLALGTFAIGSDVFVIAGILPMIARDLGLSVEATGQIVTAYALAYALGSPLLAALSAGWPRRRTIILALAGFAACDMLAAAAPNLAVLMGARILAALSAALYVPTAYLLAAALAPAERRGAGLSTVILGTTSALLAGVPLGTWIGHQAGWGASFRLAAALAAIAATALILARIPPLSLPPAPRLGARFAPLAKPKVLLVLLAQLLWSTGNYSIYIYSAVLLGARLGVDDMALLLLVCGIGSWLGSALGGRLVDRFGATAPTIAIVAVNTANIGALNLSGASLIGAGAGLFILGFAGWAVVPAQQARLLALEPLHGGVVISLLTATAYVGSASGAALGGLLLAHAAPETAPLAAAAAIALGLALFLVALRAARQRG